MFIDYDDYMDYEIIPSEKDIEMEAMGYSFITNFFIERESLFRKAAELHNLDYSIENETYDFNY